MSFMSENMKAKGQQVAFWGLLFTIAIAMLRGAWVASQVHTDVEFIKRECLKIESIEKRVYRLEVKAGISTMDIHTNTAEAHFANGDL